VVRDVHVSGLTCDHAKTPWTLRGFEGATVEKIVLEDCTFGKVDRKGIVERVTGLELRNVRIGGEVQR
jgi:hypothetical protein